MRRVAFRRKTVVWLAVVIGLSFAAAVAASILGPDVRPLRSSEADAYSRSALGHRAFVEMLRELGTPVVVSRFDSGRRAGKSALLLLAEPRLADGRTSEDLRELVRKAGRVVVVLPKWNGHEDPERPGWISAATLMDSSAVGRVLRALRTKATVGRPAATTGWKGGAPTLPVPQLVRGEGIVPVISCDQGILFGSVRTQEGWVNILSDPDVIANHGLGRGGNAALAARIVSDALSGKETVVVDETMHGYVSEPSVYRALFSWPLICATAQVLVTVAVLLWAAMGRFGAPQPAPPPIESGKGFLIANIASLLRFGGQSAHALTRYLQGAETEVRRRLHIPADLDPAGARQWLDRYGEARRIEGRIEHFENQVRLAAGGRARAERVLGVAQRIHRWKEEMIHGPGRHS